MDLTFYDAAGRAVAYCDDERHVYTFSGTPLGYLEGDSVWGFDGRHLGWWHRGWVLDHHGAAVLFTDLADGSGLQRPSKQMRPAKGIKGMTPQPATKRVKPLPFLDGDRWSSRSGSHFFSSML